MEQFDFVVIGAGTAGCLMANRLSANLAHRVLLLEAGGPDNYHWIHIPVGYLYCIGNPRTDWLTQTEPEPGLQGRAIKYPRGRVLGGCSSINGMIYMRGQAADYARWAQLGCTDWGWEQVLPVFKQHEDYYRLDDGKEDPLHGHGGEWRIEAQRLRWEILDAFRAAAAEQGIPNSDDFNRGDNFGCGYFEVNQKGGVRWNTAKGFLHPISHRKNLEIRTFAQVTRLTLAPQPNGPLRATGLEYLDSKTGTKVTVGCRREVVMTAGAVHSPALLQLSGVGDRSHLSKLNIVPVLDRPTVGANLQDHLQLRMIYKVQGVKTLNKQANSLIGKAQMGLEYLLFRRGPMSMSPSQLGAFARSSPSVQTADLEYHVQPLSLDRFGEPLHRFDAFTASVCHLRPVSRGTVMIDSPDAMTLPKIRPNYLSAAEDQEVAANAIRLTRRIVASQALARYTPSEYLPGPDVQTPEQLVEAAGKIGTTIFHPVGTCRMGADDEAVVDSRLRVKGIDGLRIADASVMPTITSGNTNSPTLMIAERAASWILADHA